MNARVSDRFLYANDLPLLTSDENVTTSGDTMKPFVSWKRVISHFSGLTKNPRTSLYSLNDNSKKHLSNTFPQIERELCVMRFFCRCDISVSLPLFPLCEADITLQIPTPR